MSLLASRLAAQRVFLFDSATQIGLLASRVAAWRVFLFGSATQMDHLASCVAVAPMRSAFCDYFLRQPRRHMLRGDKVARHAPQVLMSRRRIASWQMASTSVCAGSHINAARDREKYDGEHGGGSALRFVTIFAPAEKTDA